MVIGVFFLYFILLIVGGFARSPYELEEEDLCAWREVDSNQHYK